MLYRYTIALVLVAVTARACSGSQNEGVSPGTTVAATTNTAVSTTVEFVLPSAVATAPAATDILVQTTEVDLGTLSSWIVPMINEATEICLGEESLILDFDCVNAVRRVCNSGIYFLETYENKLISGDENTVKFTCDLTALAEVAVFATVLNSRYNDRFYSIPELSYCRPSSLEFETAGLDFSMLLLTIGNFNSEMHFLLLLAHMEVWLT